MPPRRAPVLLRLARVWAYQWVVAMRSKSRADILADVDWWVECLKDDQLARLDSATRFGFFTGALPEFRTLVHYRLRSASPLPIRILMKWLYKGQEAVIFEPDSVGPGCFIQHGIATLVAAKSIRSHFYLHQQVTIGFTDERPAHHRRQRHHRGQGAGAGQYHHRRRRLHRRGALVLDDVGPGEVMVGPRPMHAPAAASGRRRTSRGTHSRLEPPARVRTANAAAKVTPIAPDRAAASAPSATLSAAIASAHRPASGPPRAGQQHVGCQVGTLDHQQDPERARKLRCDGDPTTGQQPSGQRRQQNEGDGHDGREPEGCRSSVAKSAGWPQ